jgi:hypothetical protein
MQAGTWMFWHEKSRGLKAIISEQLYDPSAARRWLFIIILNGNIQVGVHLKL